MENKKQFVAEYLKPLLQNANIGVADAVYKKTISREIVTVTFDCGFKKNIDVTADSLAAITLDVLNHCG